MCLCSMLLLLLSCIDEIQLKVSDVEDRLVIEGLIADSLDTYSIRVKYARNKGIYPVSDANVQVIDDQGKRYLFAENKSDEGSYLLNMKGEAGRSYHLEVTTPDNKKIKSKPGLLVDAPLIQNLSHEIGTRNYINSEGQQIEEKNVYVKADILFKSGPEKPFLRWRTTGEYEFHEPSLIVSKWCYVNEIDDLNKLNIFSPQFLRGESLKNQEVNFTALDTRFAFLYCFHVRMYTMNEQEFQYWRSVKDLLENEGTLYDPPVGNVKGNLFNINDATEQVIGYFSAAGVVYQRYFVSSQALGSHYVNPPCNFSTRSSPPCRDCLILKNSTLNRPGYWP